MGFKALLFLEKLLMLLPKGARKNFFLALAYIASLVAKKHRAIAMTNLDFLFQEKLSLEEKKEIVAYSFKNLALNFLHAMELRHMSKEELQKRVTIENIEAVQQAHANAQAIVYVSSHYASWELGSTAIGGLVEPVVAVYKKLKNREYEEWLLEARGRFGNISMEKTNVVKSLIRNIKNGVACGILIDTNINKKEGVTVEFMGKSIRQTSTPAYLARKFNAAIIPVSIRTDDEEHYTLTFYDAIDVPRTQNEQEDIQKATQAQADWLASLLQKEPKFWFWLHRRFKGDYPNIYKS